MRPLLAFHLSYAPQCPDRGAGEGGAGTGGDIRSTQPTRAEIVRIRAGGRVFEVSHAAIRRTPSLLASLLAGRRQLNKDESGAIVLAVDATSLEHVIAWLNTNFLPVGLTENAYGLLIATAKTLRLAAFVQSTERRAAGSPMTQAELIGYLQIHARTQVRWTCPDSI